jgi:thiaminase (transcriptional activator TenA)
VPCTWSYGEIAGRLAGEIAGHPVYSGWVGFYLTPEYTELDQKMRAFFDQKAAEADLSPEHERRLADAFDTSSRLEESFWQMAYTCEQWPDLRE